MKRFCLLWMFAAAVCCGCSLAAADEAKTGQPLVLAHYMSWYESKEFSGKWGWHWTMNHYQPDNTDAQGRQQLASHFHPLAGAYDSRDPALLEYHTSLMKIAGIDGVIVDWFGPEDINDYAMIHERAEALIEQCRKRGLKFAICYEERILNALVELKKIKPDEIPSRGREHLQYCAEKWFNDPLYVKWQGQPVLLSFGPEFVQPPQWNDILKDLSATPALFLLHRLHPPATGSYGWPPMWRSKEGVLAQADLADYLDQLYRQASVKIGAVMPGFHDIYAQAGSGNSYGSLDDRQGATFRDTLKRALESDAPLVQVCTWNDFGEGTSIEPTSEYEYRYLEDLQAARAKGDAKSAFTPDDLRLPLRIYQLRNNPAMRTAGRSLDRTVELVLEGQSEAATKQLATLEKRAGRTQRKRAK